MCLQLLLYHDKQVYGYLDLTTNVNVYGQRVPMVFRLTAVTVDYAHWLFFSHIHLEKLILNQYQ